MYQPDGGDHQANHWRRGSFYEANKSGLLTWMYDHREAYDFSRCLDLGASIGNHSVFFAGELGAEVVAVEPYTPHIARHNLSTNGLRSEVMRRVIGSGFYTVSPGPRRNIGMTRFIPTDSPWADYCIEGVSVKAECEWATFVKVDIEGMAVPFIVEHRHTLGGKVLAIECDEAAEMEAIDRMLEGHERLPQVFNATPTHVYLPCA